MPSKLSVLHRWCFGDVPVPMVSGHCAADAGVVETPVYPPAAPVSDRCPRPGWNQLSWLSPVKGVVVVRADDVLEPGSYLLGCPPVTVGS
jgi:hypothetical protein